MKAIQFHLQLLFCLVIFLFLLTDSFAIDITLIPSIDLKGEYNDNVTFAGADEKDDYIINVKPGVTLDYSTELIHLDTYGAVDVERYADETELDIEKYEYALNTAYQFMPRWQVSSLFSFVKDTTIDADVLFDELVVTDRQIRKRFTARAGLSYQITERSNGGLDFDYAEKRFDGDAVDSNRYTITFTYERMLKNQIDQVLVTPFYQRRESDGVSDIDIHGLLVGWYHPFSETISVNARVGARYVVQDFKDFRPTAKNWGPVADVSFEKVGDLFSVTLGYRRLIKTPSDGEPRETDRIHVRTDWRVMERLVAQFKGYIAFTRSLEDSNKDQRRFFNLRPSLIYRLTENHHVRLTYDYSNEFDKDRDSDRDRQRIFLTLNFTFPKK
jgi:hypothetical protein